MSAVLSATFTLALLGALEGWGWEWTQDTTCVFKTNSGMQLGLLSSAQSNGAALLF